MYSLAELKERFNSEQMLIILLSRLYFGTSSRDEVADFLSTHQIDPTRFYRIASVHNIRPLLYHVISSNNLEVDGNLLKQLKNFYLQNQLRSMEQLVITHNIVQELKSGGITAIPFKGVVFAHSYYGNIGLRESTDIDLLTSPTDINAAEQYFQQKGFTPKLAVPSQYLNYYKRYFKEIVYTSPAKTNQGYSVEIHWKLLNYYFGSYPNVDLFLEKPGMVQIGDLNLPVLNTAADFLAVTSNHFIKDMGVKFKYLVDIAALIHHSGKSLDVSLIEETIDKHHCRKRIEHGLFATTMLLGKSIDEFQSKYNFQKEDISALNLPLSITNFMPSDPKFLLQSLQLQDGIWQKASFLRRCIYYLLLPTDNDLNTSKFIHFPIAILALIRPFRLGFKALSGLSKSKQLKQ